MLTLYIGNKNYSSWSMRPWVLMKARGIAFTEVKVRFDSFDDGSLFRRTMAPLTPIGKVPLLRRGGSAQGGAERGAKPAGSAPGSEAQDDEVVWDSLAITEALAEWFPEAGVWPTDARARARVCTCLVYQADAAEEPMRFECGGARSDKEDTCYADTK